MVDKTALNTGYTYYANIVFACGFVDASGNFTEILTDTQIGVVGGTTSRGTDGTHGEFISLESDDSDINFGDNAAWDGTAEITVSILAQNDATDIPGGAADAQWIFVKSGSGADAFECVWQNGENVYGMINASNASIVDGLDDGTSGAVATNWNNIGVSYDGSNMQTRVNALIASTTLTGSVPATAHDLIFGNIQAADRGWLGNVAGAVILDVGLTNADWADLTADWTGEIFAASGGVVPLPAFTPNTQLSVRSH